MHTPKMDIYMHLHALRTHTSIVWLIILKFTNTEIA